MCLSVRDLELVLLGFGFWGLDFRVGFGVWGLGVGVCRVCGVCAVWYKVWISHLGFRVKGLGFRVQGVGLRF